MVFNRGSESVFLIRIDGYNKRGVNYFQTIFKKKILFINIEKLPLMTVLNIQIS